MEEEKERAWPPWGLAVSAEGQQGPAKAKAVDRKKKREKKETASIPICIASEHCQMKTSAHKKSMQL